MGFYGNITNTSKTQFQFDRIYPNRATMESTMLVDGIYAGRYVLIEYDSDLKSSLDTFLRVYFVGNIAYTTPKAQIESQLNKSDLDVGDIVYTAPPYIADEELVPKDCVFWKCTSSKIDGSTQPATFEKAVSSDSNYVMNFNIDTAKYGEGRGYDSTVWQKVYVEGNEKYVQIAELNSVVPTFDISADAPTVYPIQPHFDVQSTNVYYKLHWQPQWGMRLKEATLNRTQSDDKKNYPSDEETAYIKYIYDPTTGSQTQDTVEYSGAIYYNRAGFLKDVKTHYDGEYRDSIQVTPTGISGNTYNVHDPNNSSNTNNIQPDIQEFKILLPSLGNTISDIWDIIYGCGQKVEMNGTYSGNTDNLKRFRDIEWKDAVTGEENAELGGMTRDLETLAGCINKVHDLMGMIITDKNNAQANEEWFNKNYIYKEGNNYYRIHKFPTYTTSTIGDLNLPNRDNYTSDQEYNFAYREAISTKLQDTEYFLIKDSSSANYRVEALNEKSLSALDASTIIGYQSGYGYEFIQIPGMPGKMATIYGLILQMKNLLEIEDSETRDTSTVTGAINALNDIIKIFEDLVPGEFLICDANGHVNSANWTTAQDYSYTNYNSNNPVSINKTFDTKENRWISLSIDPEEQKIELNHIFNKIDDTVTTSDKNDISSGNGINNSNDDTLKLYTPIVDAMGHVVGKNIETVTLPYSYKTIQSNELVAEDTKDLYTTIEQGTIDNDATSSAQLDDDLNQTVANNSKDLININTANKWIQTKVTDDTLVIAHEIHAVKEVERAHNLNNLVEEGYHQDKITVQDTKYDAAGHVIENRKHTYTLPYGYKTFKTNGRNIDENTKNSDSVGITETTADNTQDIINIDSGNYWVRADITNDNIKLSHSVRDIDITPNNSTNFNTEINAVDEDNINIPDWTYDAAGHIRSKKDHYYTLPFGYKTITPTTQSTATTNPTVNTTSIVADNTQDTLTIASTNKWIRVSGDDTNDTLSIGHEVHNFESGSANTKYGLKANVTVSDLDVNNTFEVPVLKFDEAGHITMAETHTVTVPENFNKVDITITGKDNVAVNTSSAAATLEADTLTDTVTFDVGNRWIQLVGNASTDKVSIHHAAPGAQTNTTKTGDETPNYGTAFNIPEIKYDEAGHISGVATHTVTFPTPSLNDLTASTASVVTGIQMVDGTLAITQTNANVGTRALTEYLIGSSNEDIVATDSINTAFGKLQVQMHEEENNRAKAVTNLDTKINTEINNLNTELTTKINDLDTKLSNEISNVNTNLTTNIENEATTRANAVTNLQNKISTLEETVRTQDETIATLQNTITGLITRIEALEAYHPLEEETPITGE